MTNLKMKSLALGAIFMLGAYASAQKIEIEADSGADFTKFHSFVIREGRLNSKNPSLNGPLIKKKIEDDIRIQLVARGLTPGDARHADLGVHYTLGAARKVENEAYPAGWRGMGTRIAKVPYTEGTLVIDLRDTSNRSLIWRAIAREEKGDASKIEGKLDDMVKKSFEKYPPKAK